MLELKTLGEILPYQNGIFTALKNLGLAPWGDNIDSEFLDSMYILQHSGSKYASSFLIDIMEVTENKETAINNLAKIINIRFGNNFRRLYEAVQAEYNPIDNYSMVEESNMNGTSNRDGTRNNTQEGNSASNSTGRASDTTYGFNSTIPAPVGDSSTNSTVNNTASNTTNETITDNETRTTTNTITRKGNIGVTTSQQMLQSELDLWQYDLFDHIFNMVDKLLALRIYGGVL